jgi:REP element-mobilizing transposase RayT
MARSLRINYKGALYPIASRGNERRDIFKADKDRNRFIKILQESLKIYNVILYSYVLMPNHFLLETPLANISEFMRQFNITYTCYSNKNHKEIPSIRKIYNYCLTEEVIETVCQETGNDLEDIKKEAGTKRQILMEMLYSYAGLKGREIGKLLELDYSTVSVGRKRLRSKIANDNDGDISKLVRRIRNKLSIIKI